MRPGIHFGLSPNTIGLPLALKLTDEGWLLFVGPFAIVWVMG